jgi:hypothetical protein
MSVTLDETEARWRRAAIRQAAVPFALACACLPVLDLCEQYSVVPQIAAGLQAGALPAVPAVGWLKIAYFAAVAVAAAGVLARKGKRGRWWLWAGCVVVHSGYALASGLRPAVLLALLLFAWSFVALQSADQVSRDMS